MKRQPFFYRVRHMVTGCDYSGLIFAFDAAHANARAQARTQTSIAMRGYGRNGMVRTVELRDATAAETAAHKARIGAL